MGYKLPYLLTMEQSYHSVFHGLSGSSICSYPVQNVEETLTDYSEYGKLTTVRLNSHTGVIFYTQIWKRFSPDPRMIKKDSRWTCSKELIPQSL
jgi:hypothetical protein